MRHERPVSVASKRKGAWDLIVEQARKVVEKIKNEQHRRAAAESEVERLPRKLRLSQARRSHFECVVRKRRIKSQMEKQSRKINRRWR